jgi:beta-glucanase (GH16 family)
MILLFYLVRARAACFVLSRRPGPRCSNLVHIFSTFFLKFLFDCVLVTVSDNRNCHVVSDGYNYQIKAVKENYRNESYKKGAPDWRNADSVSRYTSAGINTLGKASWQYGRIEVRAKIPNGLGIWPAIWMMGINRERVHWPACGEIDIMEFVGHDSTHIFGSIHFAGGGNNDHGSSHDKIEVIKPYNDFHIYSLEWDSSRLKIFFDNTLYHSFPVDSATFNNENAFRKPFYLLVNLALGGAWGGPINDAILPRRFLIDYVRVYQ